MEGLESVLGSSLLAFWQPLSFFFDASKRVFWPALLGSALFALCWLRWSSGLSVAKLCRRLVSRDYLLHPSSRLDFVLWCANSVVRLLLIAPLLISQTVIVIATIKLLTWAFAVGPQWQLSVMTLAVIYSICVFVIEDYSRFWVHRLLHKNPYLWLFHQVHHSAEVLTPFSLYRIHPIEIMIAAWRNVMVVGVVTGVFAYVFKGQINGLHLLGVDAFGLLFTLMFANLRHSHIALGFGPFEWLFISPAQHQIHHQYQHGQYRLNYGSALALWDRAGGSWRGSKDMDSSPFGLNRRHHNVFMCWLQPFSLAYRLWRTKL